MKNNKGFIISTTLYSAFGIMMITVTTILFVLSNKQATMSSMTDKLKLCIEECNTPENICDGMGDEPETKRLIDEFFSDDDIYPYLYSSKDTNSGQPTYYFNGQVLSNYVKIGNWSEIGYVDYNLVTTSTCAEVNYDNSCIHNESIGINVRFYNPGDDIIWRIIRINEDGSIRLTTDRSLPISYTYHSSNNWETAHTALSKWYDALNSPIIDTYSIEGEFCTSLTDTTFKCPEQNIIKSKIGLISNAEVYYSRNPKGSCDVDSTYLANGTWFITMFDKYSNMKVVPSLDYDAMIETCPDVYWRYGWDSQKTLLRPVINLSKDTLVANGTGSRDDPYILTTPPGWE